MNPFHDFPDLAEAAARLLAERQEIDPKIVAAGKGTAAEADRRDRVARALVAILRAVMRHEALPEPLPASIAEIRADLAGAVPKTAALSASRPGDSGLARQAARLAALERQFDPTPGATGTPNILFCHAFNQHVRALRAAGSLAEVLRAARLNAGGDHVDRSAVRAPLLQQGRGVGMPSSRPTAQAALL